MDIIWIEYDFSFGFAFWKASANDWQILWMVDEASLSASDTYSASFEDEAFFPCRKFDEPLSYEYAG